MDQLAHSTYASPFLVQKDMTAHPGLWTIHKDSRDEFTAACPGEVTGIWPRPLATPQVPTILWPQGLAQEHQLLGLGMAFLLAAITIWLVHQQCGVCQQVCPQQVVCFSLLSTL